MNLWLFMKVSFLFKLDIIAKKPTFMNFRIKSKKYFSEFIKFLKFLDLLYEVKSHFTHGIKSTS